MSGIVSEKLVLSREELFRKVDPEQTYKFLDASGEKLGQLHNWAVYLMQVSSNLKRE